MDPKAKAKAEIYKHKTLTVSLGFLLPRFLKKILPILEVISQAETNKIDKEEDGAT